MSDGPGAAHGITVRRAVKDDLPKIRRLVSQMPSWCLTDRIDLRDENLVAVGRGGRVVGWLRGNHVSQAWANVDGYAADDGWLCSFITWLLVDESSRGDGIGGQLLGKFAQDSELAGRDTIIASPQSGKHEAELLAFYARNGYRRAASGQVHRGPHGPTASVPLPGPSEPVTDDDYGEDGEKIIREYRRRLGLKD